MVITARTVKYLPEMLNLERTGQKYQQSTFTCVYIEKKWGVLLLYLGCESAVVLEMGMSKFSSHFTPQSTLNVLVDITSCRKILVLTDYNNESPPITWCLYVHRYAASLNNHCIGLWQLILQKPLV